MTIVIVWPNSSRAASRNRSTSVPLRESRLPVGLSAKTDLRSRGQRPGHGDPLLLAA